MSDLPPTSNSNSNPSNPSNPPPTTTMPSRTLPLTLILAATPKLGIGQAGQLPWPQLRTEMGYFARVTKRVPSDSASRINAVIMGRKTWDSIPPKFRPLKGRLNVVIMRDASAAKWDSVTKGEAEGPIVSGSLEAALDLLQNRTRAGKEEKEIDRVFVIGGASIYKKALELPQTDRVLLTKIRRDYECDTHFPVDLDEEGWVLRTKEELEGFVGEVVPGVVEEKGVEFEFCLYEKER